MFDSQGRHLATHGGTGQGPGEMEGAFGLMLAPDGTLWVPDYRNARMSVYDPEAGFLDSHELEVVIRAAVWRGIMTADGRILKLSVTRGEPGRDVLRVYGADMTLAEMLPLPDAYDRTQAVPEGFFRGESGRWAYGIPFFPEGHRLLDPRGGIWSTEAGDPSYRIKRWTAGGDTTLVVTTRRPPSRLPTSVRDSAIDAGTGVDSRREWRQARLVPRPRRMACSKVDVPGGGGHALGRNRAPGSNAHLRRVRAQGPLPGYSPDRAARGPPDPPRRPRGPILGRRPGRFRRGVRGARKDRRGDRGRGRWSVTLVASRVRSGGMSTRGSWPRTRHRLLLVPA